MNKYNSEQLTLMEKAAPDLLEFAMAHDAYMLDAGYPGPDEPSLHPKAAANWRHCRAAIAKATGAA